MQFTVMKINIFRDYYNAVRKQIQLSNLALELKSLPTPDLNA